MAVGARVPSKKDPALSRECVSCPVQKANAVWGNQKLLKIPQTTISLSALRLELIVKVVNK